MNIDNNLPDLLYILNHGRRDDCLAHIWKIKIFTIPCHLNLTIDLVDSDTSTSKCHK